MYSTRMSVVLVLAMISYVNSLGVLQCNKDKPIKDLESKVKVTNCEEPPCLLVKGSKTKVEMEFTLDHDVKDVTAEVKALVWGLELPFIGVDGTSACGKIFFANEPHKKADCPLKGGTDYIFKTSIKVEQLYPEWTLEVFWSLNSGKKRLTCFKVPAKIVKAEQEDDDE